MEVIEAENVSVLFHLRHDKWWTFKKSLLSIFQRRQPKCDFWALRNVSFKVNQGESLGIIGKNGSGKTTLLRIIAGIYKPDEGSIRIRGRVSTLLGLAVGFQPELSGMENIYINGAILGLRRKQIDRIVNEIIDFSELDSFIDVPVKTYSSGMHARLGFSIAVNTQRDVMLVDEILGVGDSRFRKKCENKMRQFQERGKTIILVSHSMEAVKSFCNRVIWMDKGTLRAQGRPEEVIEQYLCS
jgi:ABC-type polysaccharide/polyol phosphate transport system ATPase subunit